MKKPVLVSAILAAAAFFIFVLVMTQWKKAPAPPSDVETGVAAKTAVPPAIVEKTAPPTPEAGVASPVVPPPAADDVPAPTALTGQVLIEGVLRPLAGAIVRAAIDQGASRHEEPSWIREAVSDARGRFQLVDLPFAPLRVRASSRGYLDAEATDVFPGDDAKLVLAKQDGIPCVVEADREEGAAPLPRQKVTVLIPEDGWTLETETDDAGKFLITGIDGTRFELARKDRLVEAAVPGFAAAILTAVPPGDSYKVTVEPGATVEGTVLDARTGKPVPHARVHSETGHEVEVDERGGYRIGGVDEDLTAYAPGYSIQTNGLDDHEANDTLRIDFKLARGVTLKGAVKDSKGKPLAGVRLAIGSDALDIDSSSEKLEARLREVLSCVSGADGGYRLEGLPIEALGLPGEIELEVRPPGTLVGFSYKVEIAAKDGEVDHDIIVDLQEVLVGSVTEANGKPVARAGIFVESVEEDFSESSGTSANGKFQLRSLRAGKYHLRVERDGRAVHLAELTIPSEPLGITLDALAVVKGQILAEDTVEPLAGLRVTLHVAPGSGPPVAAEATTDNGGRFAIPDVPRGEYVLFVRPGARAEPFSRFGQELRHPINVPERGWIGEVRYPLQPSGDVAIAFAAADSSGVAAPADGPVWVTVTSFLPAGDRTATPARGEAQLVQDARQGFHARWREGEYRVRCAISIGGKQSVKEEAFTLDAGGRLERTVTFTARQ